MYKLELFYLIFFFLFGLTFGSFFNVVGLRSPRTESFLYNRSCCPKCKRTLNWYELIPLFSFLIQQGKCRSCKMKISFIYPFVESLTGVLFAFGFWMIGFEWELITALLLISMLMIIFVSDLKYMIIQNRILLFFLPFFLFMRFIVPLGSWWSPIAGGLGAFLLVALLIILSRGGMGAGDMKLFAVLGIVLGHEKIFLTFFLACFCGAFIGILLMLFKLVKRKQPIPFGPYIVFAALISYFYGESIIDWYLSFLI
ncbi:prepilin peptidase [Oceanobacillus sp. FSL H7-0719]|uniref:prepilin peptidase n=1 Tax=Oceanobacillus sp. FSL H7-0719 TaxID=2954507 RepID=UPI0032520DAE